MMSRFMPSSRTQTQAGFAALSALLIAAALVIVAPAPAQGAEPAHLDETFSQSPSTWAADWYDNTLGSRNRISAISDGSDGQAIRVSMPAGSHFGSAMRWRFGDHGLSDPNELYFRYYIRFPTTFENHDRGKLPGPAGLYGSSAKNLVPPTDANPGWSARMVFSPTYTSRDADHTQLGYYVYHRNQAADEGDIVMWDPSPGALRHGSWYCVEGHVAMNTPGVANGSLTGWVDEAMAFYQDDFVFRGAGDAALGVKEFWLDVYFGGSSPAPVTLGIDFDSLALSDERIGCGDRPPGSFRDTGDSVHQNDIRKLAHAGVTRGCNPPANDLFCPTRKVSRGQMAAFLSRALSLPAAGADTFTDDDDSVFEGDIEKLFAAGITKGCGPGRFCPDRYVTRGEMAAFLDRALDLPAAPGDRFRDDDDSIFEGSIQSLAAAGITLGCNPPTNDRFCPDTYVSREQMASFLSRALDLPAPPPAPPGPVPPAVPPGYDAVVPLGWSIDAVADAAGPGAKILIRSGTHLRQTITPQPNQTFVGESGTVLDGMGELKHAFVSEGPDAVNGVTIRNVAVADYTPNPYRGAIHTDGSGWTLEDCEVRETLTVGVVLGDDGIVRRCHLHRNGLAAIFLDGASGVLIEDNEIAFNNHLAANPAYSAGGTKFVGTTGLTVRGNHVHDNTGYGLWAEAGNSGMRYENNLVEDNLRSGIYHDSSHGATITSNTVRGNGFDPAVASSPYKGAGILIGSPQTTVTGNTLTENFNGIIFFNNNPAPGFEVYHGTASGNTIVDSGRSGVKDDGDAKVLATTSFSANDYVYTDVTERWWQWQWSREWAVWQSFGHDTDGSLTAR